MLVEGVVRCSVFGWVIPIFKSTAAASFLLSITIMVAIKITPTVWMDVREINMQKRYRMSDVKTRLFELFSTFHITTN